MKLRTLPTHLEGEAKNSEITAKIDTPDRIPIEIDTFDGKVHVDWDPDAALTPFGQLPFFIQFLKIGQRFEPWVDECPLEYTSNNAPTVRNVLGSLLLSVLSGHKRFNHITTLRNDNVNPKLLGMTKVVSSDSARRSLLKMDEGKGVEWLQSHLLSSYLPLLNTPWILDTDVTVKPLYGYQEAAVKGYNPHKKGRPSHAYHSYLIANLRLVLDVEVQAGNHTSSTHSLPRLLSLLAQFPDDCKPEFVRGDCDWGADSVMTALEEIKQPYLFKMKKGSGVKGLIRKHHGQGHWQRFKTGWEVKETELQLASWSYSRRVILIRRKIQKESELVLEHSSNGQLSLGFIEEAEEFKLYEYSVLVTDLTREVISIVQLYRDRADCENNFDELKNHWGWGGYTTQQLASSQLMSRLVALIYNWWNLFVRLIHPDSHLEAITSRPLLLSSIGKLTQSGRQKHLTITDCHGEHEKTKTAYHDVMAFFNHLKVTARQLTGAECWQQILKKITELFESKNSQTRPVPITSTA